MIERLLGLPPNAAAHGAEIDNLIFYVHLLMALLFVGWGAFYVFALFRYRSGRHPKADYYGVQGHTTSYLEMAVAIVELGLLFGLSVPFWFKKVASFPPPDKSERVRVVGQQFAWNIHYPGPDGAFGKTDIKLVNEQSNPIGLDRASAGAKDDIVTLNQLHLPVDKPAIVYLTTKDVIHSFFLPLQRVKQDAIPGMEIPIYFTPTKTTEQLREELAETIKLPTKRNLDAFSALEDYKDKDGNLIVKKGRSVSQEILQKLLENGFQQVRLGPKTPTEIACAQLCGLGHYRMRGFLTVHTQESFDKWMAEKLEALEE
jgi:cytochrome c oxidase subunit 2